MAAGHMSCSLSKDHPVPSQGYFACGACGLPCLGEKQDLATAVGEGWARYLAVSQNLEPVDPGRLTFLAVYLFIFGDQPASPSF